MLKRARISMEIALVVAIFAFTGILHTTAPLAKIAFCGLLGFSVLSLLLGLFEETAPAVSEGLQVHQTDLDVTPDAKESALISRVAP